MIGERLLGILVSFAVVVGGGVILPKDVYPYIQLVDILSTYVYIFSIEKRRVDSDRKGESWRFWDYFQFLRNYIVTSFVRGLTAQLIGLIIQNNVSEFNLPLMIKNNREYMILSGTCFIVVLAFWPVIDTVFSYNFIYGCATVQRMRDSLAICNRYADLKSTALPVSMLKDNLVNGCSTLMAYTFIDVFFRGDFKILQPWFTVRIVYLLVPLMQVFYHQLGMEKIHSQLVFITHSLAANQNLIDIPRALGDGRQLLTLAMFFMANHLLNPLLAILTGR